MICVLALQVLCVRPATMYLQLNPVSQKLKVSIAINTHYDVKEGKSLYGHVMHRAYRALCICSNLLFANDQQSDVS